MGKDTMAKHSLHETLVFVALLVILPHTHSRLADHANADNKMIDGMSLANLNLGASLAVHGSVRNPKQFGPPPQHPEDPCLVDAQRLCPDKITNTTPTAEKCLTDWSQPGCEGYLGCLYNNTNSLSRQCKDVLNGQVHSETPSIVLTTFALVLYAIPLLGSSWAFFNFRSFERRWRACAQEQIDPVGDMCTPLKALVVAGLLALAGVAIAEGQSFVFIVLCLVAMVVAHNWTSITGVLYSALVPGALVAKQQHRISSLSRALAPNPDSAHPAQSTKVGDDKGLEVACYKLSFFAPKQRRVLTKSKSASSRLTPIVSNVTARFLPGHVTAIIGPSGCGKTTLLNLLTATAASGTFSGARILNSVTVTDSEYRNEMKKQGYVPQYDTLIEQLTVLETLMYAAMVRLPQSKPLPQIVDHVMEIVQELGLSNHVSTLVGGETIKGISGGQRRRLTIAIEMLRRPSVLFLDEPTSGLDGTTSLKLMQTLHSLAKLHLCNVITTIHQPRVEILQLLDHVLLLDKRGHVAFHGPCNDAIVFFSQFASEFMLDPASYDNPLDFIIDMLDADQTANNDTNSNTNNDTNNDKSLVRWFPSSLSRAFLAGEAHTLLDESLKDVALSRAHPSSAKANDAHLGVSFKQSVWVMFGQRMLMAVRQPVNEMATYAQIMLVGWVIATAFSYSPSNVMDQAYQTVALMLILSSYAMIIPYLTLVPEYFVERRVMKRDRRAGVLRYGAYVVCCMLHDMPRAVTHTALLLLIAYRTADLNTQGVYVYYCFSCLIIGVAAWQALIGFFSMVTDSMGVVYSLIFLVLGTGFLFGGLIIVESKIPKYFLWAYFVSIPAVTSRALVVNELYCCRLTLGCDNWDSTVNTPLQKLLQNTPVNINTAIDLIAQGTSPATLNQTTVACPSSLQQPDAGNFGRAALSMMELNEFQKGYAILALIIALLSFRALSVAVLNARDRLAKMRLKEVPIGSVSLASDTSIFSTSTSRIDTRSLVAHDQAHQQTTSTDFLD